MTAVIPTLPALDSRWVCTATDRRYRVIGHREPQRTSSGRMTQWTVVCRRDDRTVILPLRAFGPGGNLRPDEVQHG